MPRDLCSSVYFPQDNNNSFLTASPEVKTPQPGDTQEDGQGVNGFIIHSDDSEDRDQQASATMRRKNDEKNIHPYVQTLSLADLDSCLAVENTAFPEHHRATREKLVYRLTTCPEISLGLFSSTKMSPSTGTASAHDAARPPDSSTPSHRALLLAHVIATLTSEDHLTDASMEVPSWFSAETASPSGSTQQKGKGRRRSSIFQQLTPDNEIRRPSLSSAASPRMPVSSPPLEPSSSPKSPISPLPLLPPADHISPILRPTEPVKGHNPMGRTIAIHSIGVLPAYQSRGLGRIVVRSYLQRMESSGIADRAVLICEPALVRWYEGFGFVNRSGSKVTFGGGKWRDMVYEFQKQPPGGF